MKYCHDEVAAKDHGVGDDDHGGEAEVDEAGDELVEESDDEEQREDPAGEENNPSLDFLVPKSGRESEDKDGEGDDDRGNVRLEASYLGNNR